MTAPQPAEHNRAPALGSGQAVVAGANQSSATANLVNSTDGGPQSGDPSPSALPATAAVLTAATSDVEQGTLPTRNRSCRRRVQRQITKRQRTNRRIRLINRASQPTLAPIPLRRGSRRQRQLLPPGTRRAHLHNGREKLVDRVENDLWKRVSTREASCTSTWSLRRSEKCRSRSLRRATASPPVWKFKRPRPNRHCSTTFRCCTQRSRRREPRLRMWKWLSCPVHRTVPHPTGNLRPTINNKLRVTETLKAARRISQTRRKKTKSGQALQPSIKSILKFEPPNASHHLGRPSTSCRKPPDRAD